MALISGGIAKGLIGGAISGIGQIFGNRSRKREAQRQRQFNIDMWNRQNAYNTPKNQMERLRKAGLNPALMYGQGNVGNADKVQGYQQPQITDVGANMAQQIAMGAQVDLVQAQREKLEAEAENISADTGVKMVSINKIKSEVKSIQAGTKLTNQNLINQQTVDKLNQEYLKLEQKGYNKGNLPAVL